MNVRWRKLFVKISFWLASEIVLNFLGIDDLADYSEFIFENKHFSEKMASGCTISLQHSYLFQRRSANTAREIRYITHHLLFTSKSLLPRREPFEEKLRVNFPTFPYNL